MSDETTFSELPPYRPERLLAVSRRDYAAAVEAVTRLIGPCDTSDAERLVDAVCGPLNLVPPKPLHAELCDHSRFTADGQWLLCNEDHELTGRSGWHSMTSDALPDGFEEWRVNDPADGRSFVPLSEVPRGE